MVEVTFEYKDRFTNGEWRRQSCTVESVEQAKEFYGLGVDCEYRIVSVEERQADMHFATAAIVPAKARAILTARKGNKAVMIDFHR